MAKFRDKSRIDWHKKYTCTCRCGNKILRPSTYATIEISDAPTLKCPRCNTQVCFSPIVQFIRANTYDPEASPSRMTFEEAATLHLKEGD